MGYSDSDAVVDAGNDYETYDVSFGLNFAFPWAYIAVGNAISFNDYKREDTSVSSTKIRSDYTNTCLLYTSPSPRDMRRSRMPSSA